MVIAETGSPIALRTTYKLILTHIHLLANVSKGSSFYFELGIHFISCFGAIHNLIHNQVQVTEGYYVCHYFLNISFS